MASPTSNTPEVDPKAKEILFRRYWSNAGWTKGIITPAEYDYAKGAGLMFDPMSLSHDAIIAKAENIRSQVSPESVGQAFLASLSTRRLDWRSALGSLAAILHLPSHSFAARPNSVSCRVCGEIREAVDIDISVFSFERLKWGGVRHAHPSYAMRDLEWFATTPSAPPTSADQRILTDLIERISTLPDAARPADLEKALRGLLPSNAWERRTIIDILGLAGILIPRNRPTFWGEYPFTIDRESPVNKNDWKYPILWWTGADGINRKALKFWFPNSALSE
jgi:hypothetical protein